MKGTQDDRDYYPCSWIDLKKKKQKKNNLNNDLGQKNSREKCYYQRFGPCYRKKKSYKVKNRTIKNTISESSSRSGKVRNWMTMNLEN